jgi:hypothetical protein
MAGTTTGPSTALRSAQDDNALYLKATILVAEGG